MHSFHGLVHSFLRRCWFISQDWRLFRKIFAFFASYSVIIFDGLALGWYPAFVLCLLDAKARVFAIRSCKSNEPKGFKFSKPRGEQKGVVTISNKNLLDPLRAVTGEDWIPGKRYKVRGFWVADAKTMCFDLNEGVQEDFRHVTPSDDAE